MDLGTVGSGMKRNWTLNVECQLAAADLYLARRADMAREFGVHDMTLARRLAREGTRWQDLLDAERRRRCEHVLRANRRACFGRIMQRCGVGRQRMHALIRIWFGTTLTEIRGNPSILNTESLT